ncbi:MAG: phosphomannomutase/phosphoglucomutase [Candidatus Aminicenantes bacterium]|jgi:phosphomannomutase/phosphoglucomutase|nr:phosphomannomutase/phosphoglucomutase [Candidatus Aminicenantes bacterium]MDH5383237.1 phosphomannomutase/phosphoglucomutase [Candidatus Aminicenantes bacterium]MDH5742763.1 phosphomannomutase/phosphoglucomutase [Candidatus Aminicenantes bacterium]
MSVKLKPEIFRQYDIRGLVDKDLTPESVEILGKAIGTYFRQHSRKQVALGRDCRLSSPEFSEVLSKGLMSTGCTVVDLGIIPTPLLYFTIYYKKMEAGAMITGSHNPPEYNGFKMMLGEDTLYGPAIQDILKIIQNEEFIEEDAGVKESYNIVPEYENYVVENITLHKKIKVVVDAGNGTGGVVAVPIFKKLGCEVIELFCEMDGTFPNHHPDPTLPEALETLIETVAASHADLGIAYDGDADRIGVIDDRGNIIWGDQLMIIFARDILPSNPGATVISEVKASKLLYEEVEKLGGRPIMWKTGHSLIKKKIKEEKALMAGEMSGHIFFADRFFGFDDAIYSSARLLEILSRSDKKLSEMLSDLPRTYHTPEIRVYASDAVKFKIVEDVKKELSQKYPIIDIDGVRAQFPKGWGLVRASNTQEVLVLRFEADTEQDLADIRKEVEKTVERAIQGLEST